jgi:flavin reductase (DIM6/NTAB) family NADH-FMN oxidoreductase RutF
MVVVTATGTGCLVGFSTQVSIDPPRYLACISKASHTHAVALHAPTLVVHVLDGDDRRLAEVFGELTGDAVDKLSLVAWSPGPDGVPVLDDAAGWFASRVVDRVDLGDHTGFVLEPVAGERRRPLRQLGFQAVKDLDPGHDP